MKNVELKKGILVLIPTDFPKENGDIVKDVSGNDPNLYIKEDTICDHEDYKAFDLYIVSEERLLHPNKGWTVNMNEEIVVENCVGANLIIATTNPELNNLSGIGDIPKKFISKFAETYTRHNRIKEVAVEYDKMGKWELGQWIPTEPRLKLRNNNTITIRPTKTYSSINVIELLEEYREYAWKKGLTTTDLEKFINEKGI